MTRKATLSPSKITTYLACPVKYRWTYIDARGKWFLRAKNYYSFGLSLHSALQRFHDSNDLGVTTTEETIASLEENWVSAGYGSPEEAAEALAEGREIVSQYLESAAVAGSEVPPLFVEKQLSLDMGDFTLVGRVDRVDELPDGTLEIIDYKSGSRFSEEELLQDVAMNSYHLLVRKLMPDRRILLTIHMLRAGERITVEQTTEQLDQFAEDVKAIGIEILDREYHEIDPLPKALCNFCDFLPLCERHEEFRESFHQLRQSHS
ncbi:MAG: PD-(D/E)XK nuclease family protein [Armatimonadetes bacterium]|nr:PD-(D/E)XK nuclease family protein [Armatimonadota bacterium]